MIDRPAAPRLAPLAPDEVPPATREVLERYLGPSGARPENVFATLARHPRLLKRFLVFGSHVMWGDSLTVRVRELTILRVAWSCRSEYEWAQHVRTARREGVLAAGDLARVRAGPAAAGWTDLERAALRAVDELCTEHVVSSAAWDVLRAHWSDEQLVDFLFTVGTYVMAAGVLNSLGVALDEDLTALPAFDE